MQPLVDLVEQVRDAYRAALPPIGTAPVEAVKQLRVALNTLEPLDQPYGDEQPEFNEVLFDSVLPTWHKMAAKHLGGAALLGGYWQPAIRKRIEWSREGSPQIYLLVTSEGLIVKEGANTYTTGKIKQKPQVDIVDTGRLRGMTWTVQVNFQRTKLDGGVYPLGTALFFAAELQFGSSIVVRI